MCPSLSISFYQQKKKKHIHIITKVRHLIPLRYVLQLYGEKMSSSFTKHEDCHGKHPYFLFKKEKEKRRSIFSLAKRLKKWEEQMRLPQYPISLKKKKKETNKQTNFMIKKKNYLNKFLFCFIYQKYSNIIHELIKCYM